MDSHRKPSVRRKLLLSLAVFVVALAACEIGMRLWLRLRGTPYSAWETQVAIHQSADAMRAFVPDGPAEPDSAKETDGPLLHPYSGLEAWPDSGGVLQYFRERKQENDFSIVVMGGSVAASFANTIHGNLPRILQDAPALAGRRVVVLNYAHATYKQPQQVMRFAFLLSLGYRPDALIEIDGFNEVALAFENGMAGINPAYPSPPVWGVLAGQIGTDVRRNATLIAEMLATRARVRAIADGADRFSLFESAILGRWTLSRMAELNGRFLEMQGELISQTPQSPRMKRQLSGPEYDHDHNVMLRNCVQCWVESSIMLHDLCSARGIRYVQVMQPTLHDVGAKPMHAAEKALARPSKAWLRGVHDGYPMLRARSEELRARGLRFIDSSRVFADVEDALYTDACHLDNKGELLWFERLAPGLRRELIE